MHVTVLVPAIHDRPTGGNIYNRRVIEEGRRRGEVDVAPWSPETGSAPDVDVPEAGVIVVDSLLTRHERPLRALRSAHPRATLVLLAHYLHCIDPNERDTPQADTERAVLPLFDGAVTTSRYARQALAKAEMPADRIAVVPPGLDAAYRAPVPERPPREVSRLLTVANLLPGKGLRFLVDVLADLTDLGWTWTLVGDDTLDPDLADAFQDRVREATLADRVTLTGPVFPDDLRARYDAADVFVLPSRFETCSMATREAMARGLPVVAHAVGGLPDNVGDADAGCLVSPSNPDAFSDALRMLLTDPTVRMRMAQAARARSQTFPTWKEAGSRFYSALRALHAPDEV